MRRRGEACELAYHLPREYGFQFKLGVVGRKRRRHLPMLELGVNSQIPGRYLAGNRMPEHAAAVCRQVIQCRWRSVCLEIFGRCAYDHLDWKELATDYALASRLADPESDIDTIQYPVSDAVIKLNIRLNAGVFPAKLVEQWHENGGER